MHVKFTGGTGYDPLRQAKQILNEQQDLTHSMRALYSRQRAGALAQSIRGAAESQALLDQASVSARDIEKSVERAIAKKRDADKAAERQAQQRQDARWATENRQPEEPSPLARQDAAPFDAREDTISLSPRVTMGRTGKTAAALNVTPIGTAPCGEKTCADETVLESYFGVGVNLKV